MQRKTVLGKIKAISCDLSVRLRWNNPRHGGWQVSWDSLNGTILAHQMPYAGAVHNITGIPNVTVIPITVILAATSP